MELLVYWDRVQFPAVPCAKCCIYMVYLQLMFFFQGSKNSPIHLHFQFILFVSLQLIYMHLKPEYSLHEYLKELLRHKLRKCFIFHLHEVLQSSKSEKYSRKHLGQRPIANALPNEVLAANNSIDTFTHNIKDPSQSIYTV